MPADLAVESDLQQYPAKKSVFSHPVAAKYVQTFIRLKFLHIAGSPIAHIIFRDFVTLPSVSLDR